MQLSFMRQWPGTKEETLFLEMIWMGLLENSRLPGRTTAYHHYQALHKKKYGKEMVLPWDDRKPKLHTIRRDRTGRWHLDLFIQYITGNRYAKGGGSLFQFAPLLKPASIQRVILHRQGPGEWPIAYIREHLGEGVYQYRDLNATDLESLAINDGFKSVEAFAAYFLPAGVDAYIGRIIHWTNKTY